MKNKLLSSLIATTVLFTGFTSTIEINQADAAVKKGTVIYVQGQPFKFGGTYKHYFTKSDCAAIAKNAGKLNSISSFVGGTSGFASVMRKAGYAGVATSAIYVFNLGMQRNLSIYKTAYKKKTGVLVSGDLYYPTYGPNYAYIKNQKITYK